MSTDGGPDACGATALSIVIPTLHRRESLLETLRALDPAGCSAPWPAGAEVVVVDNAPEPELDAAELHEAGAGRLRLLHEPRPGKGHALNTAIHGGLGEVVAVLDDDMAPMPGWARAALASASAHPEIDIFAGKSHVVWPDGASVPSWGNHFLAQGLCFSVLTWDGDADREMGGNFPYPSGNHFWFRRRVLDSVGGFPTVWNPEPEFCMEARAKGHRGLLVSAITCGHRVQPELIDAGVFLDRARRVGRTQARIQFNDDRGGGVGPARLLTRKGKSLAGLALWTLRDGRARWQPEPSGVLLRARAQLRMGRYRALLVGSRSPLRGSRGPA